MGIFTDNLNLGKRVLPSPPPSKYTPKIQRVFKTKPKTKQNKTKQNKKQTKKNRWITII